MPEGKSITFEQGEYPQLDGLEDGAKVKMEIMATLTKDGENGGGTLTFDNVDLETEGMADQELKRMAKTDTPDEELGGKKGVADNF